MVTYIILLTTLPKNQHDFEVIQKRDEREREVYYTVVVYIEGPAKKENMYHRVLPPSRNHHFLKNIL
jgi:hypothetical protein